MYKSFYKIEFFISWWAFTFPLTAITIASVVAFQITHYEIYKYLSFIMFAMAILAIGFVSYKTIGKIKEGEICINED